MPKSFYTIVEKYELQIECVAPFRVGSGENGSDEVLMHPVDMVPFVQASSLAGSFRDYYQSRFGKGEAEELFGNLSAEASSKIKFTDGFFVLNTLRMELRPHVKINRVTGTASAVETKGGKIESGQKFELEYVGTGSRFGFTIYVLADKSYKNQMVACLEALNSGEIQLGGHKSSGCGYMHVVEARYRKYDMQNAKDRRAWQSNEKATENLKLGTGSGEQRAFWITVSGRTASELLIKDLVPDGYGENTADSVNMKNAQGKYIIPGTSLKGSLRSQMERIADYKGLSYDLIDHIFGQADEKGGAIIGNLRVQDVCLQNDISSLRHRIHINKFTGGVMNQALFSEKAVAGKLEMKLSIIPDGEAKHKYAEPAMGLLLLALRDLGAKVYNLGSGYNIGRGYIDVKNIQVVTGSGEKVEFNFENGTIKGAKHLVAQWLSSLEAEV